MLSSHVIAQAMTHDCVPTTQPQPDDPNVRPYRVAIIGCGDIHVVHAAAINATPNANLVAVCDTDADRLHDAATTYNVAGYDDYRRMLHEEQPDVVHICTPHDVHVDQAITALEQGIHVLTEKPIAAHLPQARRLVDVATAADARGVHLGVCFQNRYNRSYAMAKKLIDSGQLGHIDGAVATVPWKRTTDYYRNRPWRQSWQRSGGGVLINQAIHTLDALIWFFGGVVDTRGIAMRTTLSDVLEAEDTACAHLTHPNGVTSQFFATLTAPTQADVTIDIYGAAATLHIRDGLTVEWSDGHCDTYQERSTAGVQRHYWGASHETLIADFYSYLRTDTTTPFWINVRDGMTALTTVKHIQAQSPEWADTVSKEFTHHG